MRARVCLAVLILAGVVGFSGSATPRAVSRVDPGQDTSTLDDQVELAVTVYNSDIALVRDVREPAAAARQLRSALHGHRRDGESRRPCTSDR